MATQTFFPIGSDAIIALTGLQDENGTLLTDTATVAGQLEADGSSVGNGSVTFTYGGTPGTFSGTLSHLAAMSEGTKYRLLISIVTATATLALSIIRLAKYVEK